MLFPTEKQESNTMTCAVCDAISEKQHLVGGFTPSE
jgi:hypothetical protein